MTKQEFILELLLTGEPRYKIIWYIQNYLC